MINAIFIAVIALLCIAAILYATKCSKLNVENAVLAERNESLEKELQIRIKQHEENMARQKAEFDLVRQQMEQRFSELADKALANNAERLRQQSNNSLLDVLAPMKENLENFRRAFTESYTQEARERFSLGQRVSELIALNNTVSQETRRLTDALRGNAKVQGDWGEMILDNILQQAGLRPGYEYTVQTTVKDEDGRALRPDVVLSYTDGRKVIIDSKVSIQDYLNMLNADNDTAREAFARQHVNSVKKHITELKTKKYQDVVGDSPFDYVLMFIPHEGAYLAAMNLDTTLWQNACDNRVLIISPTHLISVVKLIEQMWRIDRQNRNAIAIAEEASKMLDKFRAFIDDMDKIERQINGASDAWKSAMNKLSQGTGNLVNRAIKLEKLGAKASRSLPQRYLIDEELADE